MPSSTTSPPPIPGLKVPELPEPDLGFPLRHSQRARETVAEALKATYIQGAATGYSIGQTVGQVAGHGVGFIEGAVIGSVGTGVSFGLLVIVVFALARAMKGVR
jgi:hypothetical protein